MKDLATISLCDHEFCGEYDHYSFTFCSLTEWAKSYAIMNKINHGIPFPSIYLNRSQIIAIRDWCNSIIVSKA